MKVQDKRRREQERGGKASVPEVSSADASPSQPDVVDAEVSDSPSTGSSADASPSPSDAASGREEQRDYLDDLRRLQAEFDNYRKRMMKDQTAVAARATARLIERLLPVLDNFERAVDHGEAGPGVQLVFNELRTTLEREGLEEIPAAGQRFDPNVHEAVSSQDDPDVSEPVVRQVFRRGYRFGDQVLRPAMVAVARPTEPDEGQQEQVG